MSLEMKTIINLSSLEISLQFMLLEGQLFFELAAFLSVSKQVS